MKFKLLFLFVALLGVTALFIGPDFVSAQGPATLVPCGTEAGDECTVCHLVSLGQNILNFFVFASVVVATLLFVNAGVLYVFSPGNPGNISKGHRIFTNTLVGILIILSSWIVIDFVMRQLVNEELIRDGGSWGPWNEILCTDGPVGPAAPAVEPPPPIVGVPPPALGMTPIPLGIAVSPRACSGGGPCQVSESIFGQLESLRDLLSASGIAWRITEAYPPTRTHQNPCHLAGTCVDANFTSGMVGGVGTPAMVRSFIESASASGLRAVYEVQTQAQMDALVAGGVPASSIDVLGSWISAPHFSVYGG